MDRSNRTRMSAFLGGLLLTLSQAGNAVTISQMPLFISAGVTPNVMLVVDNSGSMNNLVWAQGFDPTATYPDWSPPIRSATNCSGTATTELWTATNGNIILSTLLTNRARGSTSSSCGTATVRCPSNYVWGQNAAGTINKCLRLPDPVGGSNTRVTGQYLNYLFQTYANNTDLQGGQIPGEFRMRVARNVATTVVNNNTNLRLGLTRFNTDQGGTVLANCGSTAAAINTQIGTLTSSTWTPLAEALYEVTRYFRGMSSQYNSGVSYTSPIQYRCQKNFVIVITDGFPTQDTSFPNNDPADVANTSAALPNWDGLSPATMAAQYPNFPSGSDGFQPAGANTDEGHTLYLDDIAKFAYDTDMRATGNDLTGVSFNDPLFPKQNLVTYTVGFAVANQMMADAARLGTGQYLLAGNEAELSAALQAALADIEARTSSAASVATNSTRLASNTFIYQARFSSGDWGGQLLAYPIGSGGEIAAIDELTGVPVLGSKTGWNSAKVMPAPASRKIFTYNPGPKTGMQFVWSALTASQQAELNKNVSGVADGNGQKRLDYLRGIRTDELPGGPFRARSSVMGDIINSDPTFVGDQNFGFDLLPGAEGTSYKTFRQSTTYKDRRPAVYVAANDGMLHGFDAETGVELLAYMPNAVYPLLRYLTDPSFNTSHRLINDGAPKSLDAYINGGWKTVLLGTLGGGGKGVYALDVTEPSSFSATRVLWEFTSANDAKMGDAIPQATIARLYNGKWVAIVSNGYNSSTGNAVLFVIDLETGVKIREFDTGVGSDNGLASATPVDVDGDRITDYIYAGDLKGNMWKFDVTSSNPSSWAIAFAGLPLYTACSADPCTASNRQPITTRPEVGISPPAGFFVYFGTGRYFAVGDNGVGTGANSIYAIRDKNEKGVTSPVLPAAGRSNLVQQSVLGDGTGEQISFEGVMERVRVTTNNPINDTHDGWYLNLPTSGERQVSTPILRGGRLIFTTVIPSGDACSAGGESWLMEIDALSGSRLTESPFDLNRDRSFDVDDFAPLPGDPDGREVPVSGRKSSQGIIKTPGIVTDDRIEYKFASGSAGGIDTTIENAGKQRGRQSWRELQ